MHMVTSLGFGGAERVLADIVAQTDRARFRHTVCYLHGPHDLAAELESAGCRPICLDAPARHGWLKAAAWLRPVLREVKPDLVHSATFAANMASRLAVGRRGPPQLSWLVSMEYDPASVRLAGLSMWKNRLLRGIDAAAARYARSSFVACSQAVRRSAIDQLGVAPENIEVIYNPVRLEALEPAPGEVAALRRELGLAEDSFVYLTIGRVDAPKAQRLLLEAFAGISGEQPDAAVVILGRGPLEGELRARARALGIEHRARFVSGAERIAPFLGLADVFVFPSLLEGLPVALLEAMCAGVPVVASDIAPHAELVRSGVTGFLAPVGSAEALAGRMRQLYGDPALRHAIAAAAADSARARFATSAIVPQWEAAFAAAARPGGRRRP